MTQREHRVRGTTLPLPALLLLALFACGEVDATDPAATVNQTPVPPEIEFEAGDLVLGRQVFTPCPIPSGTWLWERLPTGDPVVVDLIYARAAPDNPFPTWHQSDIDDIEAAGGSIISAFNTSVIRAALPRGTVEEVRPTSARFVPDPERRDVRIIVGSSAPDVQNLFVSHGGVITRVSDNVGAIHGVAPDSAVVALRAHPDVRWLDVNISAGCLGM